MFTVNTFSYIWLATAAMPALKASGGYVGVVSSLAGHVGTPKTAVYSSTKHALHGFFNALRAELAMEAGNQVSITLCAIGPTDTEGVEQVKSSMNQNLFWDPPAWAAEAIVRGVAARQREMFHPHHVVFPAVQIYQFVPSVLDMALTFFVKN
jgi:short-subunit dehydrogenase